ncbi:MAG: FAD-dependent monooxygenase [Polyangiaceae bacterium]|nr:FAD-dependent monooxygenase [Polyangiaceae bacterium]
MDHADVVIIGAGVSGAVTAHALGQQGRRVLLLDAKDPCAPCFKAEKMWPGNLRIFEKYGLKESALSVATPITRVVEARGGRALAKITTGEYGMYYQDLVNALRKGFPPSVEFRVARVSDVELGPNEQRVSMQGGQSISCRLVVLTPGGGATPLIGKLGFERRMIREGQSTGFGFDIARADGSPFPFESLTYASSGYAARVSYVTFFPIGSVMRANMFVFRSAKDEWVRRMIKDPVVTLCEALPGLENVLGPFTVPSRVETAGIDLWRLENAASKNGIVVLGDAFQGVCPSTGTGFDKVLTDVDVLCSDHVPEWFKTDGMSSTKIAAFYGDPRKQSVDRYSLQKAQYERWAATSPSWSAGLHRAKVAAEMYLAAVRPKTGLWADRTYA